MSINSSPSRSDSDFDPAALRIGASIRLRCNILPSHVVLDIREPGATQKLGNLFSTTFADIGRFDELLPIRQQTCAAVADDLDMLRLGVVCVVENRAERARVPEDDEPVEVVFDGEVLRTIARLGARLLGIAERETSHARARRTGQI